MEQMEIKVKKLKTNKTKKNKYILKNAQSKRRQKAYTLPPNEFRVGHLLPGMTPAWKVVDIPRKIPLEEADLFFPCQWVSNADSSLGRGENPCPFPLAEPGPHLAWTRASFLHAAIVSSYVRQSCCVQKALFPYHHPWPSTLKIFLPPPPHASLCLRGSKAPLMKIPHLGPSASKSLPLHIVQLWVSLLAPVCSKKRRPWYRIKRCLLCGYSSMTSGAILLLCSFSRIIVLDFPLGPKPM